MREAAKKFEFERAAQLRDRLRLLKHKDVGMLFQPALFGREPLPVQELLAPEPEVTAETTVSKQAGKKPRPPRPRKSSG
jgi:hypothetical protein